MSELKFGTKLYRISSDYELEELTYSARNGNQRIVISSTDGRMFKMAKGSFDNLCLSKIMILRELEEILKTKLTACYKLIGMKKIEFNPIDTPEIIYLNHRKPVRAVHQYHPTSGKYIASFKSIVEAGKATSTNTKDRGENISKCCRGLGHKALGFRWSYDLMDYLPENHVIYRRGRRKADVEQEKLNQK